MMRIRFNHPLNGTRQRMVFLEKLKMSETFDRGLLTRHADVWSVIRPNRTLQAEMRKLADMCTRADCNKCAIERLLHMEEQGSVLAVFT